MSNLENIAAQKSAGTKTIFIDTRCKEMYYQTNNLAIKESASTLEKRHTFWNYMMNVSMQNTVAQMAKRR